MIKVINKTGLPIKVSINHWGSGGDTSYFTIEKDKAETWDRTDARGFVMATIVKGVGRSQIVFAGTEVVVDEKYLSGSVKTEAVEA
ncbi:hypothetical protein [Paludibacterium yongneupense]|uniref:hypothetical protein n=1 Tax=Paludibacterium yongneupense TaxID=400061 RepID=UPI0004076119|nr:hypothetical protein [Paludibacterium yongneupense]